MQAFLRPTTRRSNARITAGDLLRSCVGVLVAILMIDTWCVGGLLAPLVVVSPSMSPTLTGPMAQWQCGQCGRQCALEIESSFAERPLRCRECGAVTDQSLVAMVSGDRVLVDRAAFAWRAPVRFEIVVALNPDDPRALCVKRVVGLPGESLRLAGGQVWCDDQELPNLAPDTYYTSTELSAELGENEYYLLGDNSRQSRDSRDWSAVPASWIVGRAIHWPSRDPFHRASR